MADDLLDVTVTFKAGPAQTQNPTIHVRISPTVLNRLVQDINGQQGYVGSYEVETYNGDRYVPGRLVVRFAEVLAIS